MRKGTLERIGIFAFAVVFLGFIAIVASGQEAQVQPDGEVMAPDIVLSDAEAVQEAVAVETTEDGMMQEPQETEISEQEISESDAIIDKEADIVAAEDGVIDSGIKEEEPYQEIEKKELTEEELMSILLSGMTDEQREESLMLKEKLETLGLEGFLMWLRDNY